MNTFIETLKAHIEQNPPNYGDGESILTLLYEAYSDINKMDNDAIKKDFGELYKMMNGMTLTQMDAIMDLVCTLCRDHERTGFIEGIKVGIQLKKELVSAV